MFLNVPVSRKSVTGADLQVGDVVRNPRTDGVSFVIGGSEFTEHKMARQLTTRNDRRQDIALQAYVDGEARMFAVPLSSTYELINTIDGFAITA